MGQENEIGSLEAGKKADIAVINLDNWHTRPLNGTSVYSQLVYQARANDVWATFVDGKLLMLDGKINSIDSEEVKTRSEKALLRVLA